MTFIEELVLSIVITFFVIGVPLIMLNIGNKDGYLEGQADAIQGNIKVTLVQFKNGERKWYYIKDLNELNEYTIIPLQSLEIQNKTT